MQANPNGLTLMLAKATGDKDQIRDARRRVKEYRSEVRGRGRMTAQQEREAEEEVAVKAVNERAAASLRAKTAKAAKADKKAEAAEAAEADNEAGS